MEEGTLMSNKHTSTNKVVEPLRDDKLRLINGIGPAVEERLNRVGIFTLAQLATLSPADIAAAVAGLAGLSAERIIKQDWIGQARKLAAKSMQAEAPVDVVAPIKEHAITDTYTLETQQSLQQTPESLASEATKDLEATAVNEQVNTFTAPEEQSSPAEVHVSEEVLSVESEKIAVPSPAFSESKPPDHIPTKTTESELLTSVTARSRLAGTFRAGEIELIRAESNSPSRLLPSDQPFDVRLTLDLVDLQVPDNTALNYKASIYGKGRGKGSYSGLTGEAQGTLIAENLVTINVGGNMLPDGIYQLAAMVILALKDIYVTPKSGITAMVDGGQVQIY
jgi:hypothetical protein